MQDFVAKLPDILKPWGEEYLVRYVDFQGTTDRKKFWTVILTQIVLNIILIILCLIPILNFILIPVVGLCELALMVPAIAMQVRRLRDTDKHWAFLFFSLIPLAGMIILIVFYCQE